MYHIAFKWTKGYDTDDDSWAPGVQYSYEIVWKEAFRSTKPRNIGKCWPCQKEMKYRIIHIPTGKVIASTLDVREEADYATRTFPKLEKYKRTQIDPRLERQLKTLKRRIGWAEGSIRSWHSKIDSKQRWLNHAYARLQRLTAKSQPQPQPQQPQEIACNESH